MQRNSATLVVDGAPQVWIGTNFWSRTGGPLMWRTYDLAVEPETGPHTLVDDAGTPVTKVELGPFGAVVLQRR